MTTLSDLQALSDEELVSRCATDVMGFKNGNMRPFDPLTNWNDTLLVMKKLPFPSGDFEIGIAKESLYAWFFEANDPQKCIVLATLLSVSHP